jgi:RHS repeat-associated protein
VHFGYDALNRRYLQTVENGSGTILSTVYYVNQGFRKDRGDAGDEIALRLDGTGAVISRYLHGSLVDEVLAEENIGSGGARDVLWAMTDHQGSVRDLARVTSGTASVVNHIVYDAFGKTVSETDAAIAHLYGYTGRELDKETGLQYNRARYLDLVLARWISQDPKSFAAGDTNLYRFVGNHPSYATDPSGLEEDYRKIFFDAAKRSAMNSVPFLTELEQEELSSVETQRRGKLSKFWEVHHWYSQDSTMGKWLTKQLPDIGSVNDPRNLSLIPYHIHTEITEEQKHFWEKISKKYELGYDRTKPYSLMASNIELLSNIEQTAIAEQYDVFVKDQKYRFSGFYLDTSMTAIDIVNVTRKSSHSLPLGLAEKAIERLAKSQPKFLGRIRDISSSLKDSAKWIKDGGKTFGLPFLAFIAASTGPIVGAATAKEDAIEDLVDHYALCLDRCRRGTEVSAHGVMDIQDLSPKFDAVAHLFGLNDEIRGFATYYFHVLSFRRK